MDGKKALSLNTGLQLDGVFGTLGVEKTPSSIARRPLRFSASSFFIPKRPQSRLQAQRFGKQDLQSFQGWETPHGFFSFCWCDVHTIHPKRGRMSGLASETRIVSAHYKKTNDE